jgi:hypothetical protein
VTSPIPSPTTASFTPYVTATTRCTTLSHGETFNRIWRDTAYRGELPAEFAPIGFLPLTEVQRLLPLLQLRPGQVVADLAFGAGGPGLWAAQQSGATLIGIDPASAGLAAARQRVERVGLADHAEYRQKTFEPTGLEDATVRRGIPEVLVRGAPDHRDRTTTRSTTSPRQNSTSE